MGWAAKKTYLRNIDKRVAVIGAGPAGITAASDLAGMGYKVTVFESTASMGGMVRRVIPKFRLPDDVWKTEFDYALGDGIDIEYGLSLGHAFTIEDLFKDGYKAVVVAVGAPFGKKLNIPGKDFKYVYTALGYMNDAKYGTPVVTGENVVVIGGGSVATDAARTALRYGAKNVTMVCIEEDCAMPAHSWEIEEALEEGVQVVSGYAPQSINSVWMQPESVTVAKVTRIIKEANGALRPEIDKANTKQIKAETVIFAVGQSIDNRLFDDLGFERNERGGIVQCDKTYATSKPGVFAAGDLTGGKCSVVEAMSSARKAAKGVDAYLSGRAIETEPNEIGSAPLDEKIFPVRLEKLVPVTLTSITKDEAIASFDEVNPDPEVEKLQADARRCMKCGYIKVDHDICVGCGTCRKVCPGGDVITMGAVISGGAL
jgi:NADPH-dependent glutamate synthase beta subunit-like oxidoreductase